MSIYDTDLDKNPANYQPLTPLSFLARSARFIRHRNHSWQAARVTPSFTPGRGYVCVETGIKRATVSVIWPRRDAGMPLWR
jgi:hypothetical protein